jgi:heptosyltransferase-2
VGDLVIASPFLRAAAERFSVTLVAKPFAEELRPRFWPDIKVEPFTAPWTAFHGKYHVWKWPLREMLALRRRLKAENFDYAVSARWDPRDHFFLKQSGARECYGFPRLKSDRYLTVPLQRPPPLAHRYEYWRVAGKALGLDLPAREDLVVETRNRPAIVLIHTGARLPVRVWPLDCYKEVARRLRAKGIMVQIACDTDQLGWWQKRGEQPACPQTVTELLECTQNAGVFIGNDSGPGHLAAVCGVPTFTLYGPMVHEWFVPLHPAAEIIEGRACPYKPCSDYCRFERPFCLEDLKVDEVWPRIERFVTKHLPAAGTGL